MRSETRKRIKRRKEDRKETLFLRIVRYADREKKNLKINTERRSRLAGWLTLTRIRKKKALESSRRRKKVE